MEQRGRVLLATLAQSAPRVDGRTTSVGASRRSSSGLTPTTASVRVVLTGTHPAALRGSLRRRRAACCRQRGTVDRQARRQGVLCGSRARCATSPGWSEALERTPAAGLVALERFHEMFLRDEPQRRTVRGGDQRIRDGRCGCELALACDARVMAEGDEFGIGQPEILFGFPPGGGGTQRLARLLGSAKALRLVIDGGPLQTRPRRCGLGLIDAVVPGRCPGRVERSRSPQDSAHVPRRAWRRARERCTRAVPCPLPTDLLVERSEFMAAIGTPRCRETRWPRTRAPLERTGELPRI